MSIVSTVRSWALPGGAIEAQSLSSGGASGPSPVEQYKHKACASGASGSFRELLGSFQELCGVSGPAPVEQYKHKVFAIAELLGPPRWSSTGTKSLQLRSFWALPKRHSEAHPVAPVGYVWMPSCQMPSCQIESMGEFIGDCHILRKNTWILSSPLNLTSCQ